MLAQTLAKSLHAVFTFLKINRAPVVHTLLYACTSIERVTHAWTYVILIRYIHNTNIHVYFLCINLMQFTIGVVYLRLTLTYISTCWCTYIPIHSSVTPRNKRLHLPCTQYQCTMHSIGCIVFSTSALCRHDCVHCRRKWYFFSCSLFWLRTLANKIDVSRNAHFSWNLC